MRPTNVPLPPPPADFPWPEDRRDASGLDLPRLKLQQPVEQKPLAFEEDAGTKKCRRRLSSALEKGKTEELQAGWGS